MAIVHMEYFNVKGSDLMELQMQFLRKLNVNI